METANKKPNDALAIERTKLANERTFLAYFRTFIIMISSGLAILKLEILHQLDFLGIALIILAPLILALATYRYFHVKRKIGSFE
ncbi:MAG: DUF202 domain-containing protein [Bacteroidetes bacterium]|nr:DUF202 domain-containing protein [Bacteroidota bacterium]